MVDACDPDANIDNLRQLIKLNTGVDIKLTKKEICQAYNEIQEGKLPLPPMVMNSTRTYLVDKRSPLKPNDYELLFDSNTRRADLKKIARKVDLKNVDQMTKSQITDAIGKRLRYMKIHEPVKFARRRHVSVNKDIGVNDYNSAMNDANVNQVNNTAVNNTAVNTNVNRVNTNVNRVNTNVNRVNTSVNRVNTNVNRVNTNVNRPQNRDSKITLPKNGLFVRRGKPKFLGGTTSTVKAPVANKKPGFFAGLFGKKKDKNFVPANKFKGSKEGYVFKQGEKGSGYYLNVGAVQGPQIPRANITQPIPTKNEDFSFDLAIARVKQLELKREKQFLNKIQLGRNKRKQVVAEAEKAKQEEKQLLTFLDSLDISNTNRQMFKNRMALDDFKQLQVEAQLKADEKTNVIRTNEEKMAMFLKTTNLTNTNQTLFLNKARANGSNINALIEEARKLNSDIKSTRLSNKRDAFRKILQNYNKLNASDKNLLISSVTEASNVNSMKKMADELLQKRIEEKKNVITQNLLTFLTPLQIKQKNKDEFLRRFRNEGVNINSIKTEALKLQESNGSTNIEALRLQLETQLSELGLNQLNKNAIMKKFTNGNQNVNRLIAEAKELNRGKNLNTVNLKKLEVQKLLNQTVISNKNKMLFINRVNLNTNMIIIKKEIQNLNRTIKTKQRENERTTFVRFLNQLGLNDNDKDELLSKYNSNMLTINALRKNAEELKMKRVRDKKAVNKKTLLNYMNEANIPREVKIDIERRFNANEANLKTLQSDIKKMVKNVRNAKVATNKVKFTNYVRTTILSQTNQNAFIRKLNVDNFNVVMLRKEVNAAVTKMIQNQRNKDRDELDEYMKTKGLTNENRKTVLNKFNANSKIALVNLKQEVNAILQSILLEQRNVNIIELKKYAKEIGLTNQEASNLASKLNQSNLNSLKNEARRIIKQKEQIKKSTNRQELDAYMNNLGFTNTNKKNVLNKNLPLNEGKMLANQLLQMRIKEKREKNLTKLNLHLGKLNLTNDEKQKYFSNLNKNMNVNTIINNASSFAIKKKAEVKARQITNLKNFMNKQTLTNEQQKPYLNRLNQNLDNLNALKLEVKRFANKKFSNLKAAKREELAKYLITLNLDQSDINGILKNFDNTNVNINILKKRANTINKSRKDERYAKDEEDFINYINTLKNLTAENKTKITEKLDGYFTNWAAVKKSATNLAVQRAKERRYGEKMNLNKFMNNLGLRANQKREFFKNLNNGTKNLPTLKKNIKTFKNKLNAAQLVAMRKEFSNLLNTLYIGANNKQDLLEKFDDGTTNIETLQRNAMNKEAQIIKEKRGELSLFMSNLGLESPDKNLILTNFNANPRIINNLKNKATQLKSARNNKRREQIRTELKGYLNTLNLLTNGNKRNILNKNPSLNNGKAEGNRIQELKRILKRNANKATFANTIKNLSNEDQTYILNKFVNLNSALSNAEQLRITRAAEKRMRERNELYNFVNKLNMNVPDRNTIMNKFNKTNLNLNTLKNEASKLKNFSNSEKRSVNRQSLVDFLASLNLNKSNQQGILKRFNTNKNATLLSLRVNAEELAKQRQIEKRLANRIELSDYLTELGLNNTDTNVLLKRFNIDQVVTAANVRKEANALLIQRIREKTAANRKSLVDFMQNLNISNVNRDKILKNFDREAASLNNLKSRASNINTAIKTRVAQRQELSNYVNNLGINGAELLQKFDNGRSTFNNLKKDADTAARALFNAQAIKAKKDELQAYMKDTKLKNINRQSFLNRVELNTNIDEIKREINELNAVLKGRDNEFTRKKSELSVYLNDLTNLTSGQRMALINKVVNANTNIQPIKNEGNRLNKAIKNKRAQKKNEMERKIIEDKKKAEEARKKAEEAKKKMQNLQTKRVATKLRGLTSLKRENRKKFMNRLTTNGVQKVLANATALNKERKEARDSILSAKKQPLLNKVTRNVARSNNFAQAQIKWKNAIVSAKDDASLQRIGKLLDDKIKLKTRTLEAVKNLGQREQYQYTKNLTAYKDDVAERTQKLEQLLKTRREAKDKVTRETAGRLRNMNKLEHSNRKRFMDRIASGEDTSKVLGNANKLQLERVEKQRVAIEQQKRLEEQAKARAEKEMLQKREKAKQDKLRANTSKMFQNMNGLERTNRLAFMKRLNRGEDPAKVISDAKRKSASSKFTFNTRPKNQLIKMTATKRFNNVDEIDKRRLALEKSESRRKRKEQERKQNRILAKARGIGVKATQKKQQQRRRR